MSQQIDRLIVSRGPAMVTFNGGFFFSKDDIVVALNKTTKELTSSAFGPLTSINQGIAATTQFTPIGEFEHLAILWPYASYPVGKSIFGPADLPLLIQPLDLTQQQCRFKAAAISKMPDLNFTATDSLLGPVEFQMVGANNTPVDDPNLLFVLEANVLDLDTLPYDPNALIVQAYQNSWLSAGTYTLTYGANTTGAIAYNANAAAVATALNALASIIAAGGVTVTGDSIAGFVATFDTTGVRTDITGVVTGAPGGTVVRQDITTAGAVGAAQVVSLRLFPWANFAARAGMKVAFALTLTEDTSDAIGHYDTIFSGLSVKASGTPQGVDEATALAAAAVQGPSAVRGTRLSAGAHNLDIFGEGVFFRLYGAGLSKAGQVYSSSLQRVPDLEWVASRSIGVGGVLNPLFFIGTAAP
jgi:hypothetical protein